MPAVNESEPLLLGDYPLRPDQKNGEAIIAFVVLSHVEITTNYLKCEPMRYNLQGKSYTHKLTEILNYIPDPTLEGSLLAHEMNQNNRNEREWELGEHQTADVVSGASEVHKADNGLVGKSILGKDFIFLFCY